MLLTLRCTAVLIFSFAVLSRAQQTGHTTQIPRPSSVTVPGGTPQLIPRSAEERSRASRLSHEIVLNVLVTDATGMAIGGLTEEKFSVLEDDRAQQISFFRPAQPPHVVLLLDALNSSQRSYAAERRAAEQYLTDGHASLDHGMAIGWLSESGIHVNAESRDPKTLLSQIEAASRIPTWTRPGQETAQVIGAADWDLGNIPSAIQNANHGWDEKSWRFVVSVNALTTFALQQENVPGRIVVLWLGPGWPLLTGPGFRPDTAETKNRFFDRIADLSNDLRDAQVTLITVASPELLRAADLTSGYYVPFLGAVAAPDQASAANLALPVLAIHSGGQVLDQDSDMATAIANSVARIDSGYSLVFQSSPSRQPDRYRSLQVTVSAPGAVVRTVTGYYAQP
jgi:VWFA-related protein